MAYKFIYKNNAESTLAVAVTTTTQTTITLASGDGANFPAPAGDGTDYFYMTLVKSNGTREIVCIVARSSDACTVGVPGSGNANSSGRGYDGSSATTFSVGDVVEVRITAGQLSGIITQLSTNVTNIAATTTLFDTGFPGYCDRAEITWKDADEIYIRGGVYHHKGTTEQMLYIDAQQTFQLGSGGSNSNSSTVSAATMFYLYIDDSAIVADAPTLGVLDDPKYFLISTTAPTYSHAEKGWYGPGTGNTQTTDRCIWFWYCSAEDSIAQPFYHTGDLIMHDDPFTCTTTLTLSASWQAYVLDFFPALGDTKIRVLVNAQIDENSGPDGAVTWRKTGSSAGATENYLGMVHGAYNSHTGGQQIITNASGSIDITQTAGANNKAILYIAGFFLPNGM
jgi:hypothetical protein